ncbi:anti-sigma factor antagonist [Blastococcus sp. TBT05-19]|uniref:STAS domain-containing protein n=1 Tax=Blastococcus sp. TBT05-19 TaxID=2250581 RepID=UPI000DEA30E1|nr:STAS domain-containing protein [Blastococcus sp. TBT05-19]RBY88228.1 anti-sigma factor antagonist [Blastococcus sp. TBT05-19]
MEETTGAQPQTPNAGETPATEPRVTHEVDGSTVRLAVDGELTDAARRPLVRTLTDLLLAEHDLQQVELHLAGVGFMNSAGLAVLVQLQKMVVPRAIEMVLVEPPSTVTRPLQLTGLWHRFTVLQADGKVTAEATGDGGPRPGPADHS